MKKINTAELLHLPSSLSQRFHQKTKLKRVYDIDYKLWPKTWKKTYFKGYPRLEELLLPKPKLPQTVSLKDALLKRTSLRKFSKSPLTLTQLSSLLYYSAGMKNHVVPNTFNRFYPSAGARYPLEIYILSLNTELENGLYHYYVRSHSLEKLKTFQKLSFASYFAHDWIKKASCIVLITALFKRATVKYGDRGYRFALIETGHLGQNFYLNSTALNISCCGVGGFVDDKINDLLDIDGVTESVVYSLVLG